MNPNPVALFFKVSNIFLAFRNSLKKGKMEGPLEAPPDTNLPPRPIGKKINRNPIEPTRRNSHQEKESPIRSVPKTQKDLHDYFKNTPGTAGGPGGCDRTLALKSRKNVRKITFFS